MLFTRVRNWFRRRQHREGRILSRFIACDVRRDILIVSAARIEDGIITGRVRTMNLLYIARDLVPEPEFEPPRELCINEMWQWSGQHWGGLPNGTSIIDQLAAPSKEYEAGAAPDARGM